MRLRVAVLVVAGCTRAPTQVSLDFTNDAGFFASPFPSDTRRLPSGRVDLGGFPNPAGNAAAAELLALAGQSTGFAVSAGIFFQTTGPVDDAALPTLAGSLDAGAGVFLVDVDPRSAHFLSRVPAQVAFLADAGPYGAPRLLSLLPLQGTPLDPLTTYAAVVTTSVTGDGKPLVPSKQLATLAAGAAPPGMSPAAFATYTGALLALGDAGVATERLAALAVFTAWDPTAEMAPYRAAALALPVPAPAAPFALTETFDTYCVYRTTIAMPDFQAGTPPYGDAGGGWVEGDAGPLPQGTQTASFVVTVPRAPMPDGGFPLVVFCPTGAGPSGTTPLVDRGTEATPGGPPIVPGSGPAEFLAMAGWAATSIDGPLDGLRNPTDGGSEDYLIFNVLNPLALRDNIRESALELQLISHLMDRVAIDASGCPGVATPDGGPVGFNPAAQALMGHSMGGTIAPLALAFEPRFRAAILSGEGGSWIENILYKESPQPLRPGASLLLGDFTLSAFDPILSILQWAGEPADPPAYAARAIRDPRGGARNVLMFQGILDTYILPPIANASSLAFGLDLGGAADDTAASVAQFTPLATLLPLTGGSVVALPRSGNRVAGDGTTVTALVVQHPQDPVEDGHEVMFQTDAPKHQYLCFLKTLLTGVPRVPADGVPTDPCE